MGMGQTHQAVADDLQAQAEEGGVNAKKKR